VGGDLSVALPFRFGGQGGADDLDAVTAAQEGILGDKHVAVHARQIERRGRRRSERSARRTSRSTPWPQGRRATMHLGQQIRPATRSASTAASSIPTMSKAGLRLRQEEPLRDPWKGFGEGALARSGRAHADARAPSRQTRPAYLVLS
jgi:hypothetical protein